ncbi:hypothetical protein DICVIV_11822 [Dictyocaulus viviparus]|uniref:Uncharacterized protein n=1 Tax=Dictyocaulus viviparus TaxID=29172 RepID=A0A0D8XC86_DICVI|nr:hypothetical protein DICVIV_11822 [Dictyocaulus viviparus]
MLSIHIMAISGGYPVVAEKTIIQLEKSLNDVQAQLQLSTLEKEKLAEESCDHKVSIGRLLSELPILQEEFEEIRSQFHGEQCRNRELTSRVENLQHQLTGVNMNVREMKISFLKAVVEKLTDKDELFEENCALKTRNRILETELALFKVACFSHFVFFSILENLSRETKNDLFDCNMALELRENQCHEHQAQIKESKQQMQDKEEVVNTVKDDVPTKTISETKLKDNLEEDKDDYEEVTLLSSTFHEERSRLDTSQYFQSHENDELSNESDVALGQLHEMSASTITNGEEQEDPSFENLAFFGKLADSEWNSDSKVLSGTDENEGLRKRLDYVTNLLRDAEAANAALIDQNECMPYDEVISQFLKTNKPETY